MRLKGKHILILFIVFILALSVVSSSSAYTGTGFSHDIPFSKYSSQSNDDILNKYDDTDCQPEFTGKCTYVTDGDTIEVDGLGKVRFVGVNTPERGVEGYICSKRFVQKFCLDKEVSLDIDDSKYTDKYGRYLAVVIVDGKNLNEMLLKEGLAEVMYIPPSEFYPYDWAPDSNGYSNYLSSHSSSNSGSSSSSSFAAGSSSSSESSYIASANSHKFHYPSCRWSKKIYEKNKITFKTRNDAISQGYEPCKVCQP
ncbi:thermonuclease family protein [uncultured Methanobrevibacter sp.]|uniref:thermonuclease family protein n=1 Tax=uncultured Methanobrevibacter sp. TaxID=253161 RepID=UPI0025E7EC26|nr:thermonuclease family protein [uncultured Methanobrevibacter sp.]